MWILWMWLLSHRNPHKLGGEKCWIPSDPNPDPTSPNQTKSRIIGAKISPQISPCIFGGFYRGPIITPSLHNPHIKSKYSKSKANLAPRKKLVGERTTFSPPPKKLPTGKSALMISRDRYLQFFGVKKIIYSPIDFWPFIGAPHVTYNSQGPSCKKTSQGAEIPRCNLTWRVGCRAFMGPTTQCRPSLITL